MKEVLAVLRGGPKESRAGGSGSKGEDELLLVTFSDGFELKLKGRGAHVGPAAPSPPSGRCRAVCSAPRTKRTANKAHCEQSAYN